MISGGIYRIICVLIEKSWLIFCGKGQDTCIHSLQSHLSTVQYRLCDNPFKLRSHDVLCLVPCQNYIVPYIVSGTVFYLFEEKSERN